MTNENKLEHEVITALEELSKNGPGIFFSVESVSEQIKHHHNHLSPGPQIVRRSLENYVSSRDNVEKCEISCGTYESNLKPGFKEGYRIN